MNEERAKLEEEQMQLALELSMMEQEHSLQTQSTIVFTNEQKQEDDEDDAVIVVEDNSTLFRSNWIALFVDDVWQREKRHLFELVQ